MTQVSIIIPHFNRSMLLRETLGSVKAQTFTDWEIIIVDDGSTEVEYDNISKLESENVMVIQRTDGAKGPSRCRNIGAEMAKGKYLLFLDSDDLFAPHCLAQRVTAMEESLITGLGVFLMEEFISVPGDSGKIFNQQVSESDWSVAFIKNDNPWNVTCPMWRNEFFKTVGGFDEDFLFMEDPELHLRAINVPGAGIKTFYHLPADSYYRVNHIDSTKGEFNYNSIVYRIAFYQKILKTHNLRQSIPLRKAWKAGLYQLTKTFLFSRLKQFPDLVNRMIEMMQKSKLYSGPELSWFRILLKGGAADSRLATAMHLKGICYKLLP